MDKSESDNLLNSVKTLLSFFYRKLKDFFRIFDKTVSKDNTNYDLNEPVDKSSSTSGQKWRWLGIFIAMLVVLTLFNNAAELSREEIPYSEFLSSVKENQVEKVIVTEKYMTGKLNNGESFITFPLWNEELAELMQEHDVEYTVRSAETWLGNLIFNWIIPIAIFVAIWSWLLRRTAAGAGRDFLNIGNKIRIHPEASPKITFDDVAGSESAKQELRESIDFLKSPEKIQQLGGRMPKGVLLMGPPGTGKTLLARAVSGEADVPFFNISGSEFIELFVGVGAARVRDMFEQARKKSPCIIFIDELDAIGRSRGGAIVMGGHDEREQTLNQLLTEMDGFDPSSGVIVMAATNRPEVLDKALLRAGRFDRQIIVDKPDLQDRVEILKLHCKELKMADDIDLTVIGRRTPGLVGADLANIANEGAIIATRHSHREVSMADFEAAIDRVLTGPERKNRVLNPEEKHRVAYHEAGHSLVAEKVPTGQPVHKISIIPRGVSALGFTLQLPVEEKYLSTERELKDQLAILLGGLMSEELVLGCISSGAQNDLEKASEIARNMVCYLGMSKKMGPLTFGKRQQLQFLPTEEAVQRNYSEETARLIDSEIKALIEEAQKTASQILTTHRGLLDQLADLLKEKEVIGREELAEIFK